MNGSIPESLSLEEKRELLQLVRIKYGPEAAIPRNIAIDKICEKALVDSSATAALSIKEICERLSHRQVPLRFAEVRNSLERLCQVGKAQRVPDSKPPLHFLSRDSAAEIAREISEANARIERVVSTLYRGIEADRHKLRKFLFAALSEIFARFGKQWVHVRLGRSDYREIVTPERVKTISEKAAHAIKLEKQFRTPVYNRSFRL